MRSHIDTTSVKRAHRYQHIGLITTQLAGLGVTLAALEGIQENELSDSIDSVRAKLAESIKADPQQAAKKLHEAKNKFRFKA
ncbi:hypothetical protein [Ruegeria sp. HKCCA4812]|uniref:hypothetical protein n=1 Tax=Ruegeria sp. HKCCA4812 TaxID=2682993 RepID=UPI00148915B1|nr:hypothetical protein [Ruegeria sp. HKCCA4812]